MARSLNKVTLIGNLTRDPELRYTPQGTAVCTFGLATNRQWTTESGEKKEDAEFHRIVAWNKLAELCAQLLSKGRKAYVEGRLQTRTWTGQDEMQRTTTEIVISDMIILDTRRMVAAAGTGMDDFDIPEQAIEETSQKEPKFETEPETVTEQEVKKVEKKEKPSSTKKTKAKETSSKKKSTKRKDKQKDEENPSEEDMPF